MLSASPPITLPNSLTDDCSDPGKERHHSERSKSQLGNQGVEKISNSLIPAVSSSAINLKQIQENHVGETTCYHICFTSSSRYLSAVLRRTPWHCCPRPRLEVCFLVSSFSLRVSMLISYHRLQQEGKGRRRYAHTVRLTPESGLWFTVSTRSCRPVRTQQGGRAARKVEEKSTL